ncbi:Serine carboxypeptidase-like 50 [Chlorella vulgaris]
MRRRQHLSALLLHSAGLTIGMCSWCHVLVLLALFGAGAKAGCPLPPELVSLPNATSSGYLEGIDDQGSRLFFLFYEAQQSDRGGPGCASLFGAFYELGPELVDSDLNLQPNPGDGRALPTDEMTLAADLYAALQSFFLAYPHLQRRPLVIAGESYAGKYVPSIGHFILQQAARHNTTASRGRAPLHRRLASRELPQHLLAARPLLARAPLFDLQALAIGNGLTDPASQVMAHADTAYFMGWIDPRQRLRAMTMQLEIVQLITAGLWEAAHELRGALLAHIQGSAGVATLMDMQRSEEYDADKLVDCYLNLREVQEALGVEPGLRFESCSSEVGDALGADVMKSVRYLLPDLLAAYPLLLYQGMRDAQDGAASCETWIYGLDWDKRSEFSTAERHIVRARDVEDAERRQAGGLSQGEAGGGASTAAVAANEASGAGIKLGSGAAATRAQRQLQEQPGGSTPLVAAHGPPLWTQRRRQAELRQPQPQQQGDATARGAVSGHDDAAGQAVVAFWKQGGGLTHVVLPGAGHMVPRDAPLAARFVLEQWLAEALERPRSQPKSANMRACATCSFLVLLLAATACARPGPESSGRALLQGSSASATAIANAVASGNTQAAATAIADAIASGDSGAVAEATAIAAASGDASALAQAAAQATGQGADATAVAQAISSGSGQTVDPASLTGGNAGAVSNAINQGVGACSSKASSSAGGFGEQATAVSSAVSEAVAQVCGGGSSSAQAAASSSAQATATATATAFANAAAEVQSSPGCSGCASASGTATAVATALAQASAQAFASAANTCCPNQAQAIASALGTALDTQIATATASATADACASGGGTASASSSAISQAVATATASAYADAFAAVANCAASAGAGAGGTAGTGIARSQCCPSTPATCVCAGTLCQFGRVGTTTPAVYGRLFQGQIRAQGQCAC